MRPSRLLAICVPLLVILSGAAQADTCNEFASYACSKSTPNIARVGAGAITSSLRGLGFCGSTCNLSYGYATLGTLGANGLSITASGVAAGTVLYAELVNSKGQIAYITPNSEAAIMGREEGTVAEPGSLLLMGAGLLGIAVQIRRKLRG